MLVYLDTDVDTCYKRVKERNRGNEGTTVSRDYLQKLNDEYISWYLNYNASKKIFVDYNDFSLDDDIEKLLNIIEEMK